MDLKDVHSKLLQYCHRGENIFNSIAQISRHYSAETTHGMFLRAIGDHLRTAGFNAATHSIISWWTRIDEYTVCRALLGHNGLLDSTPRKQL
jgi:hypothetical protein